MRVDWRGALASISGAMGHHLDELHITLLALLRFVVCSGGDGASASHGRNSGGNGNPSIDEIDLPSLLVRALAKAFDLLLEGPERSVAWYALGGLLVAGWYVYLIVQLGRLPTAEDDEPTTSQQQQLQQVKSDDDGCLSHPPKLQPSTPDTFVARADDDNCDCCDDDDESFAEEEESPFVASTSAGTVEFDDSLPRKTIFPTSNCTERMHEWSRGVTMAVPPNTLDSWRRRLSRAEDDSDDGDGLLRVFCGALWFRFHVHGEKMEDITSDANALLGIIALPIKNAHFERIPSTDGLSIVKWAYFRGGIGHCPPWLNRLLDALYHALILLKESCKSRFQRSLHVPTCCLRQLITEILRSDNSFIRYYHEHNRRASHPATAEATHPHLDTIQTVLRATARRLQSHLTLLNVIQLQHDGGFRINCRCDLESNEHAVSTSTTPPNPLLTSPSARAERECSLNLVRWCVASGAVQDDSGAVLGLLQQERMAWCRIVELGVSRAVESWFHDLRNIELVMLEDLQQSIEPDPKARFVRVLAACAIASPSGVKAGCNPNEDSTDDVANAFYRLGMCLAHSDVDRPLAVACLEESHHVWSPALRRSVLETIPQRLEALEAAISILGSTVADDDCLGDSKLQVLLRAAHTYLTTNALTSTRSTPVSPYWKLVHVLIELESLLPHAGFPVEVSDNTTIPGLEEAQGRLRRTLEDTGRLCRCMASMLPILSKHTLGDSDEHEAIDPHAEDIASLGRAIERLLLHKCFTSPLIYRY